VSVPTPPKPRSVKISDDERRGWSSDRPRRDGAPKRPPDLSVRSQVLRPSDRLRYSPGSMLVIVSASAPEANGFAQRVVESSGFVLSRHKLRGLLAGRVPEQELEGRAVELLDAAVRKRLETGETVVIVPESLDAGERERYVRMAAGFKRPCHLILLETRPHQVAEEVRAPLNELRRRLDAGELGADGFQTVLRLGGASLSELKRIVFQPLPRDE
jgi:predicted kinase